MSDTTVIPEWTLADRIRKAREVTGLSKEEFAERVGISRNTVSNYEHGYTAPRLIELRAISGVSRVPVEWIAPDGVTRPRQESNLRPADYLFAPWARRSGERRRWPAPVPVTRPVPGRRRRPMPWSPVVPDRIAA